MNNTTQVQSTAPPQFFTTSLTRLLCIILFGSLALTQSCIKPNQPPHFGTLDLKPIAGDFVSPITVADANDGSKRLFVVDQVGKIWIVKADGSKIAQPFIDISSKLVSPLVPQYDERGLLGLAFHPNFKNNGKFYLFYSAPPNAGGPEPGIRWDNLVRVSEFHVSSSNSDQADLSTERVILEVDHPESNHNGGTIAFGHDGYLYISIGDGGNKDDIGPGHVNDWYKTNAGGNGQDVTHNLLGNILRIDVDNASGKNPYGIPSDNPFVGTTGKDEIYAYGFRNPYRFSFDMGGQHWLYAGDAGQSLYEEIDVVTKGGNYGWNVKEGTHCFSTDSDLVERPACPVMDSAGNRLIDPVVEVLNYSNPKAGAGDEKTLAIVGGNVYRGFSIPSLFGRYIFGFLSADDEKAEGKVLVAKPSAIGLWSFEALELKSFPDNLGQYVKGFGQDSDGEVYVVTSKQIGPQGTTGKLYKLVSIK